MEPSIIVHGGAWAIPNDLTEASIEGVVSAAREGYDLLCRGKTAIDAVEMAVRIMEDNPIFDAGKGSVLTSAETIEMDAIIVDGDTLNFGAVAGISSFLHPVSIARAIMEASDHAFFIGEGAEKYALNSGFQKIDPSELITYDAKIELEKHKAYMDGVKINFKGHDTVGAVAIDVNGRIAAATSTGGITGKMIGRVGDSPIIGSGAIADSSIGGVSTTGHGESILKVQLANKILSHLESGLSVTSACELSLEIMRERVDGYGGAIAIDHNGKIGKAFTTPRMVWAQISDTGLQSGIDD